MTSAPIEPDTSSISADIRFADPKLPRWAPYAVLVAAVVLGVGLSLLMGWGWVAMLCLAGVVYVVAWPLWSAFAEGRRYAVDRLTTSLVWAAFVGVLVPLLWLVWTVLKNGVPALSWAFVTSDMRNVVGAGGGIYHALIGTLLVTAMAAVISVPIGLFAAIYLVEYGQRNRIARWTTFLVDVMTGIPSIVAGLFALSLLVILLGPAARNGFGGAIALSLLMIPTVVRSAEEMLRLVPSELREASYALGVPKWRTIVKVVIPTALGGIITGVMLAVARVIGESVPLLVVAGATDSVNWNLFDNRMSTLPVYIYQQYASPGIVPLNGGDPPGYARAWAAALVLIIIVMILNLIARIVGAIFAPKTDRR